jgi:hypothetical protein
MADIVRVPREPWTLSVDGETLVAEASDLQLRRSPEYLVLPSFVSAGVMYKRDQPDMNGEDIAGWNYKAVGNGQPPKLLLIND